MQKKYANGIYGSGGRKRNCRGGNKAAEENAMLSGGNGAYADAYQQAVPGVCSASCSALRLKMM